MNQNTLSNLPNAIPITYAPWITVKKFKKRGFSRVDDMPNFNGTVGEMLELKKKSIELLKKRSGRL